MHKDIPWSYAPYKPYFHETGDIYICRVAPSETTIHLEWLPAADTYEVYYRLRDAADFILYETTASCACTITGLTAEKDYEFYVSSDILRSRIRLARTGTSVGTVVNYLHPDDEAYAFSGRYLCSPSMVRHPDGYLLTSMDLFAGNAPQNLTLIFRSDDDGDTWHYVSEVMPAFWGKLFIHQGELYLLACSTEYGDLLIGRSTDGGKTFPEHTVLLRGACKCNMPGVHKNPQNVLHYKGRIYETLEWGSWTCGYHAPMVMSAAEDADLMDAASWHFTPPLKYDPNWPGVASGPSTGNIEGTLAVAPDGRLLNIMRYDTSKTEPNYGLILAFEVNTEEPDAPLTYSHSIEFPANLSKFMIQFDKVSGLYYSIASRITEPDKIRARNLLSLMVSKDLRHWDVAMDLLDYRCCDPQEVGFQYVDFMFEGDDILYLCRTAMNGAHNYHDANYQTFHRIRNFRDL